MSRAGELRIDDRSPCRFRRILLTGPRLVRLSSGGPYRRRSAPPGCVDRRWIGDADQDRDVGGRVHAHQRDVDAVVETALRRIDVRDGRTVTCKGTRGAQRVGGGFELVTGHSLGHPRPLVGAEASGKGGAQRFKISSVGENAPSVSTMSGGRGRDCTQAGAL